MLHECYRHTTTVTHCDVVLTTIDVELDVNETMCTMTWSDGPSDVSHAQGDVRNDVIQ